MNRNIVALAFCLLSFSAFSQEGNQKDQYIGLDKSAVIEKLGQPTIKKNATGDSETLIYILRKTINTGDAPAQEKILMYSFTFDKNGKVTDWKESYSPSK